jgi:two-component system sensor histidine kinase DegS
MDEAEGIVTFVHNESDKACPKIGDHTVCPVPMDQCPCSGRRLRINYVRLQEREAKRWAMELHDGLIPHIASVKMEVEYCAELLTNSNCKVRAQVDLIKDKLDVLYSEVRSLCSNLRPASQIDFDLLIMMRSYIERFCRENQLDYELNLPNQIESQFDPILEGVMFRFLQECLHNVKKHSRASKVSVTLRTDDPMKCVLLVEDNGRGFDTKAINSSELLASGRIGLLNMQERAHILGGHLTIKSQPGQTIVELDLPWLGQYGSDLGCR